MGKPLFARIVGLVWFLAGLVSFAGYSYGGYVGLAFLGIFNAPMLVGIGGLVLGGLLVWGWSRIYWLVVAILLLSLGVVGFAGELGGAAITLIILVGMLWVRKKFGGQEDMGG